MPAGSQPMERKAQVKRTKFVAHPDLKLNTKTWEETRNKWAHFGGTKTAESCLFTQIGGSWLETCPSNHWQQAWCNMMQPKCVLKSEWGGSLPFLLALQGTIIKVHLTKRLQSHTLQLSFSSKCSGNCIFWRCCIRFSPVSRKSMYCDMPNTRRANKLTRTSRWKLFSAKRLLTPNLLVHRKPIHWMAQWKRPLRIAKRS